MNKASIYRMNKTQLVNESTRLRKLLSFITNEDEAKELFTYVERKQWEKIICDKLSSVNYCIRRKLENLV